ncbi:hypothetical protein CONLIGDRAFT_143670 [Coniochaeta ligniaria NRRL 30616]|uniref:Uncharacterized protein n=1 Tax=Coniochaeta ligniaria NRRL 30616 TaxID=1408157 RepID=A0A1J7IZZ7_9PEZI|nr:hypothetical protein CONLIGDRAFT_143670 [Coniochaeta ligniaria NRRL 30616]
MINAWPTPTWSCGERRIITKGRPEVRLQPIFSNFMSDCVNMRRCFFERDLQQRNPVVLVPGEPGHEDPATGWLDMMRLWVRHGSGWQRWRGDLGRKYRANFGQSAKVEDGKSVGALFKLRCCHVGLYRLDADGSFDKNLPERRGARRGREYGRFGVARRAADTR